VNRKRPVNLDIMTIKQPLAAITSILHRASGIFLLVGVGFLIWMLNQSLDSRQGFEAVRNLLQEPFAQFSLWVTLSAVIYHFVAGIKHLVMDMGIGETKEGVKMMSIGVIAIAGVLIVLTGVWIWA
jgi:succinate dehydrogenase / fumarate reductase cytochrome b subunit